MYHLPLYYVQLRCLNIYRSKKQNGGEFPRLFFWLDLGLSTSPEMRLATLIASYNIFQLTLPLIFFFYLKKHHNPRLSFLQYPLV